MKLLSARVIPILKIILSLIWLSNLSGTDAYFSIYVLIPFVSFYLQIKRPEYGCERSIRTTKLLSVVFSGLVILANYPLFTTIGDPALISRSTSLMVNLINSVLSFLGGICVFHPVLSWFFDVFPGNFVVENNEKVRKWLPWAFFASFVCINLVHLFLVEYPGNATEDTFTQISEMVSGNYSNFNTFWHTILLRTILSAGYKFCGDLNGAVAVFCIFQILVLAAAFTYSLITIYDYGVSRCFLVAAFLIYAIVPYNIALSITIWKDVLFAAGCLFMLSAWLRIMKKLGVRPVFDYVIFAAGSLLFLLSRTNGWIIYLISFLAVLLFSRKNKAFLTMMGVLALIGWILLNPVLAVLGIPEGDIVESLSVPIQQVSRVISEGCTLGEEETELLSCVVDLEEVPDLYTNWLSDPMKVELRSKDPAYFESHLSEYKNLWLRLGMKYPWQYLKAWVDQTKGYWNGGYSYAMYSETITDNPYGLEKNASGNPVASLFRLYFGLSRHVIFFEPLHSIGLHVWICVLCFILNLKKKREQAVIMVPLLLLVLGLCLGTPVYCCFRYVYPLFVSFPLILAMTLHRNEV
ncbi:MAG: DUF6020 family protein [Faecousia sp.]